MTITEPVAGRLQALMATTPVVDRAPVDGRTVAGLFKDLRLLCAETATRMLNADYPDVATTEDALLVNISVAEAMAAQVAALQQALWAKAAKAGVTDTAVAKARGVTQQAHSKVKKAQQR